MDEIIANVIHEMERLSHLAPSLLLSAELIREAENKRQMWLRTAGLKFDGWTHRNSLDQTAYNFAESRFLECSEQFKIPTTNRNNYSRNSQGGLT